MEQKDWLIILIRQRIAVFLWNTLVNLFSSTLLVSIIWLDESFFVLGSFHFIISPCQHFFCCFSWWPQNFRNLWRSTTRTLQSLQFAAPYYIIHTVGMTEGFCRVADGGLSRIIWNYRSWNGMNQKLLSNRYI